MADYSKTVILPRTPFPMKANLSEREPHLIAFWEEKHVYARLVEKNRNGRPFILHDGPPYANGRIHLGTALNKILKDMAVKSRALRGHYSPYVPGWDCHGMPIEHQIFQKLKMDKSKVDVARFRKEAAAYARKFMEIQRDEFRRLGVLADWENPYLTLAPSYEAAIVEAFGRLALDGYVYRAFKPIYWCISCETALAEAEIEYWDEKSPSIFVLFPVKEDGGRLGPDASFMIWTTTPWTLPGNSGIALHPDVVYAVADTDRGRIVMAEDLLETVLKRTNLQGRVSARFAGRELAGIVCTNPLNGRDSLVVEAGYVSTTDGTGCVHTAPGHGEDDYYTGLRNNLPILSPVDGKGRFTEEAGDLAGIPINEAEPAILERLRKASALYDREEIGHSYPHCWRCKKPVIFRSTQQWFLRIDHKELRSVLKREIEAARWVPPEGRNRISAMIDVRPDWCLSRQRLWGVFVPVFRCAGCDRHIVTAETIESVRRLVLEHGADVWVEREAKDLLPPGFACPHCGGTALEKGTDILDVWFDSGVSHLAVLKGRENLSWPADLYLEGSDQHRGWFQTSLITSCGIAGSAPFRTVLTHGFVVDSQGRKMSKSLGNVITPDEIIKRHGAEILRAWTASEDYRQDIRISEQILANLVTTYRGIRNTIRFLLGNLHDYAPAAAVPAERMAPVDRWAVEKTVETAETVERFLDGYQFYKAFEEIYALCNLHLSSFYLDHLKDRLYTHAADSPERRSAQTALAAVLTELLRMLAPILSFTAEEAYQAVPWKRAESVFLEEWPERRPPDRGILARWERFFEFRRLALKKMEERRAEKAIGSSLEARLDVAADAGWIEYLRSFPDLNLLLMTAEVRLLPGAGEPEISVERTDRPKCARCWIHHPSVGAAETAPDLCAKCADVVSKGALS